MKRSWSLVVLVGLALATALTSSSTEATVIVSREQQALLPFVRAARVEGRVQPLGVDAANP